MIRRQADPFSVEQISLEHAWMLVASVSLVTDDVSVAKEHESSLEGQRKERESEASPILYFVVGEYRRELFVYLD